MKGAARYYSERPISRFATWSYRLAIFALVVALMAVIIVRSARLEITPALTTLGAAMVFAAAAIVLAFGAFVVIWRQGIAGVGRAVLGLFLGLALLAYPAYLAALGYRSPPITDITTDPMDPPRFEASARERPANLVAYPGRALAEKQGAAFPDIGPLQFDLPPKAVYDTTLALITKHKWQVLSARPPAGNRNIATIEAVDRAGVLGFRDDIVIRVSALGRGTRVDVRSASRNTFHDFGVNAARTQRLLEEIEDAIAALPEPKAEPEKKAQPRRPVAKR